MQRNHGHISGLLATPLLPWSFCRPASHVPLRLRKAHARGEVKQLRRNDGAPLLGIIFDEPLVQLGERQGMTHTRACQTRTCQTSQPRADQKRIEKFLRKMGTRLRSVRSLATHRLVAPRPAAARSAFIAAQKQQQIQQRERIKQQS